MLLVPFRSLASELKGTLVTRLNAMGLPARCAYGGTVPSGDEVHGLDQIRAMVATPESLSGILSAEPTFAQRISLVICDEGHLLDSDARGIGLELLLARMKSRAGAAPRFVFVSAIVPNIEEINAWLGGNDQTVIRSTYRPATAEFAILQPLGNGAAVSIRLAMHPHEAPERRFTLDRFLDRSSFTFTNPFTRRQNTYGFASVKTQAVAAARKVMPMGTTAIFAANKRGDQGAEGLARELVNQLAQPLPLPAPLDYAQPGALPPCIAYLESEYGAAWIGTQAVRHGAVLHHGDIPQETREVLEALIRDNAVRLVICTSTLAEGVNLPIRSLVLYSVQRRRPAGQQPEAMLARDIKNLVGRAGRAGANTKGLVICANPGQWGLVLPVAAQGAGEPVRGSLVSLVRQLRNFLARQGMALSNDFLEGVSAVYCFRCRHDLADRTPKRSSISRFQMWQQKQSEELVRLIAQPDWSGVATNGLREIVDGLRGESLQVRRKRKIEMPLLTRVLKRIRKRHAAPQLVSVFLCAAELGVPVRAVFETPLVVKQARLLEGVPQGRPAFAARRVSIEAKERLVQTLRELAAKDEGVPPTLNQLCGAAGMRASMLYQFDRNAYGEYAKHRTKKIKDARATKISRAFWTAFFLEVARRREAGIELEVREIGRAISSVTGATKSEAEKMLNAAKTMVQALGPHLSPNLVDSVIFRKG